MMHTIVDLNEVLAEPERRNTEEKIDNAKKAEPERQNTEEKIDDTKKNVLAFDVMRTMLSNGN